MPDGDTLLVSLCTDEYADLAPVFGSLRVKHLRGYTEETLKGHVMLHGAPDGLVPPWLKEKNLRSFLDNDRPAKHHRTESASSPPPKSLGELLCKLRPQTSGVVTFASMDNVVAYFGDCFAQQTWQPRDHWVLKAGAVSLLKVDVPCDVQGRPDLLRLALPSNFPSQQRAAEVLGWLRSGQCVFAAAVSGAGKTRLAFDLAQLSFAFYFDMNGGHGKVRQQDVSRFMAYCCRLSAYAGIAQEDQLVEAFDHVIWSLYLARWVALVLAKRAMPDLTPARWLWLQTDEGSLCNKAFQHCMELSPAKLDVLRGTLLSHFGIHPFFLLDEAQELLGSEHFTSRRDPFVKRPLGYRMVQLLADNQLACFVSGTNLGLKNFAALYSAAGARSSGARHFYNFDFLAARLDGDEQGTVDQLLNHVLRLDKADVAALAVSLQGRPRFTASAIDCALSGSIADSAAAAAAMRAFLDRLICKDDDRTTLYGHWKRLYDFGDRVTLKGGPVLFWELARDMLLHSLFEPTFTFGLDAERELVSRGVTMLKQVPGAEDVKEFMAEPVVLSAGLTFFLQNGIDLAGPLVKRLHDHTFTDPQHRGRVLELLAAVRLFQDPGRFAKLPGWPADVSFPAHPPQGVLVNVALTDLRVGLAHLDTTPQAGTPYWISLPENRAGPDLVMPRTVMSFKSTTHDAVTAAESRKAIKTTSPLQFYTKKGGGQHADGAWKQKHEQVVALVSAWKAPIARVRVELPTGAPTERPSSCIQRGNDWCGGNKAKKAHSMGDVLLFIDKDNEKLLFETMIE